MIWMVTRRFVVFGMVCIDWNRAVFAKIHVTVAKVTTGAVPVVKIDGYFVV